MLWLCRVVTEGEKSCRGVFMVQTCLQSSTRVHSHHLFTRTHLTAGVPEMYCLVLMCAQEEEQRLLVHSLLISATLGICHLHLNCPAYDYAFLLSYKPHSTLNWGLVWQEDLPSSLLIPRPLYLLFCFESFSWVTLSLYSTGTSSQRHVLKIPSWANFSPIKTHTNTHPSF